MSALPSSLWGVPTQMKAASASAMPAWRSVVKRRAPEARCFASRSSSPGSKMGDSPRVRVATLAASTSTPRMWCPASAKQAAATSPTYPEPMTSPCIASSRKAHSVAASPLAIISPDGGSMAILAAPTGNEVNLLEVMLHAGPVSKSVLAILATFSLLSWVVIIRKALLYHRSREVSERFRGAFKRATDWRDLKQQVERFALSPLVGLFVAGYGEVTYQLRQVGPDGKPQLRSMEAVERSLQRASVVEMGRLERSLGGLATVAAVSPFIGLFGTVWGIIDAFRGIGATGNANLATVAPGISEALVATAIGLVAAIPALMAYNFFQGQLKQFQTELDDFSLEFISLSERNFT